MSALKLLNHDVKSGWNGLFKDFDRVFGEMDDPRFGENVLSPAVDVRETEKSFEVEFDVPGFVEKDLDIELKNNQIIVSGQRQRAEKTEKDNYVRVERRFGKFNRIFTLPENVARDQIDAKLEHGVLKVVLPKLAEAQPKKIRIEG